MPGTMLCRGNVHSAFLIGPTLTPGSIVTFTSLEQTFSVPGLNVGDIISDVNLQGAQTAGLLIGNSRVSAANTLAILFVNVTAGTLTPAAGTYAISVKRPEAQPLPLTAG